MYEKISLTGAAWVRNIDLKTVKLVNTKYLSRSNMNLEIAFDLFWP
jgi:hypothetical protein